MPASRLDTRPAPHRAIEPRIVYPGTPVALLSSTNPDGSPNLAPMSSFWALGRTALLGLGAWGQTRANLERTGECVINLADASLWRAVERLAPLTGKDPPPEHVLAYGGRFEPDKFRAAGLTPEPADLVLPPRVAECRLQLEARVASLDPIAGEPDTVAVQARIVRVHAAGDLIGRGDRIDPGAWRPLIYSFRRYHTLGPELGRSFREGR